MKPKRTCNQENPAAVPETGTSLNFIIPSTTLYRDKSSILPKVCTLYAYQERKEDESPNRDTAITGHIL